MSNPRAEFERLLQKRDCAAYRAVSQIQMVLDFFEALDFESAAATLKKSLEDFRAANQQIEEFRSQLTKKQITREKRPAHGKRTSNDSAA